MSKYIKLLTFPKVREPVNSKITNLLVQDVDSGGGCGGGGGRDIWDSLYFLLKFAVNLKLL